MGFSGLGVSGGLDGLGVSGGVCVLGVSEGVCGVVLGVEGRDSRLLFFVLFLNEPFLPASPVNLHYIYRKRINQSEKQGTNSKKQKHRPNGVSYLGLEVRLIKLT